MHSKIKAEPINVVRMARPPESAEIVENLRLHQFSPSPNHLGVTRLPPG
jgi:hypothetical protein